MLEGILVKWGYQPVVTQDGIAAWDVLRKPGAPSLAALDWNMPGITGLEICRRVREQSTSNPPYIILLTARGAKADIVDGLEAGANDYVLKPYDSNELRARIRVGQRMVQLQAELNHARETLAHEAAHDALTGAFNRRAILEVLDREISRSKRSGGTFSIGIIDLDHFKRVNDTFGHPAGDGVLRSIVATLNSNLREYDCLGRYGGEEFIVIAPGSIGTKAEGLYERLCAKMASTPVACGSRTIRITASIGVAVGTGEGDCEKLLGAADAALYQAKANGRNCVVYSMA